MEENYFHNAVMSSFDFSAALCGVLTVLSAVNPHAYEIKPPRRTKVFAENEE